MAQAKFIPLLTRAAGLCNTKDPVRLSYDLKTGVSQLAQAVNVDIDLTGRISRVTGYTRRTTDASHSAWSDGERCYFVSGNGLYRLLPGFSVVIVRAGTTVGARRSYASVGARVYYTNGYESGRIVGSQDEPWEKLDVIRPDNNKTYSDPPNGHLVAWAFGRLVVAKDNFLFASEPALYGNFDLSKYRSESSRITFLWSLPGERGGLLVGTERGLAFYRGTKWEDVQRVPKLKCGVLEGSGAAADPKLLGVDGTAPVVVFTAESGIHYSDPEGVVHNMTVDDLKFPSGRTASAAVVDSRYVVLIDP